MQRTGVVGLHLPVVLPRPRPHRVARARGRDGDVDAVRVAPEHPADGRTVRPTGASPPCTPASAGSARSVGLPFRPPTPRAEQPARALETAEVVRRADGRVLRRTRRRAVRRALRAGDDIGDPDCIDRTRRATPVRQPAMSRRASTPGAGSDSGRRVDAHRTRPRRGGAPRPGCSATPSSSPASQPRELFERVVSRLRARPARRRPGPDGDRHRRSG